MEYPSSSKFKQILEEINEGAQQEVDCQDVNVEELERIGLDVLANIQDIALNVDLNDAQYSIHKLYEEGRKLGLDAGDLSEYGFELKSSKCGGKSCIPVENIRNFEDFTNMGARFSKNMLKSSIKTYRRLSCKNALPQDNKENVTPSVEYFWTLFPFNLLFGCLGLPCEILTFPCCFCIQLPFYVLVTIPWNLISALLVAVVILTSILFLVTSIFVSGWVLASFISTIFINTIMFIMGTAISFSIILVVAGMAFIGSTLAIIFAPGVIFYFAVLILIGLIFPG